MTAVPQRSTGPAGAAGAAGALAVITAAMVALVVAGGTSPPVTPSPSPLPGAPHRPSEADGVVVYGRYAPRSSPDGFTRALVIADAGGGPPRTIFKGVSCCASLGGHRVLVTVAGRSGPRDVIVDTRANRRAVHALSIPGMVLGPGVLSSDGSRMAVSATELARPARGAIEVRQDGRWRRVRAFTAPAPRLLGFSPDGRRLLVYDPLGPRDGTIATLTIATGRVDRLTPPGMSSWCCYFGSPASWSPDGRVTFAAFRHRTTGGDAMQNGVSAVFVTQPGGDAVRRVTDWGEWTTSAHWSPDTRLIAYDTANERSGAHDLFVIDPDGGSPSLVDTPDNGGSCCAVWTPNGKALVYQTGRNDNHMNLWAVNVDGSGTFRLSGHDAHYFSLASTPPA